MSFSPLPKRAKIDENPVVFTEEFGRTHKQIKDLSVKGLGHRLSSQMKHLDAVANFEKVTSKTIANFLLRLKFPEDSEVIQIFDCF